MSIKMLLSSQNSISKLNLHETLIHRPLLNLPLNPISGFPVNQNTVAPLTTTTIRWNSMIAYAAGQPDGTPPPPPPSASSGSWKNWVIGILMTFIIPSFTTKGGPIKVLIQKVDQIMDTAEQITEVVEAVADKVDKVAEELGDQLPEGTEIKRTLDFIEHVAERLEKDAQTAGDFIDKVQEMEDKIEEIMEPVLEEAMAVSRATKDKTKS
ncbi:hypothetical protein R6Q59_025541 [Mikania micrantha]